MCLYDQIVFSPMKQTLSDSDRFAAKLFAAAIDCLRDNDKTGQFDIQKLSAEDIINLFSSSSSRS